MVLSTFTQPFRFDSFRQQRTRVVGSPQFNFSNTNSIATTASANINFADTTANSEKYAPFDNIEINNASSQRIEVDLNQDTNRPIVVLANQTRLYTRGERGGFASVRITNNGSGTVNANEVSITVWKSPFDADSKAREEA